MLKYRHKYKSKFVSLTVIISLITLWQLLGSTRLINTDVLSTPIKILRNFHDLFYSGEIYNNVLPSLLRVFVGFLIGSIFAFLLGYLSASYRIFNLIITPIVEIFRPIPPIALIPITILLWGTGDSPAFFLVAFGAFFPVFTNVFIGISTVPKDYIDAASSLGASKILLFTNVIFPASLQHIFTGLKTGLGVGWFCVIVAEMVGVQSGLGYMIQINRLSLNSENVLCGMIVIALLGFVMNFSLKWLEKKITPWV